MIEGELYQIGYVCGNLEEGIAQFRNRGMRHEPHIIAVDQMVSSPQGQVPNKSRICFIWIDDMQYELIEPIEDPLGIYGNAPGNGGPIRFHQLCYRIRDWDDFRKRVDQQDLPLVMERDLGGDGIKFLYLDGRAKYGHYLEYTWMTDAAWDQIRAM